MLESFHVDGLQFHVGASFLGLQFHVGASSFRAPKNGWFFLLVSLDEATRKRGIPKKGEPCLDGTWKGACHATSLRLESTRFASGRRRSRNCPFETRRASASRRLGAQHFGSMETTLQALEHCQRVKGICSHLLRK